MTSPRHAEATAQGRYYTHPTTGQRLVSVTNVLSTGVAKPALVPWAAKVTAEHVMNNLPSIVARSRTDREGVLRDIKAQVKVTRDKAADLGTRIHALADAHVTGRQVAWEDGDEQAEPFVKQYIAWLADFGVDSQTDIIAAELTVASPTEGWAGTLHLIVTLPIGWDESKQSAYPLERGQRLPWMVDLKTSATRPAVSVYAEYAMQLTALRSAREMWLPDDTVVPIERGVVGTAVLNLRQSTYELIPVPSGPAELAAWHGALALTKWAHGTGNDITGGEFRPVTPTGRAKPKTTRTRKAAA